MVTVIAWPGLRRGRFYPGRVKSIKLQRASKCLRVTIENLDPSQLSRIHEIDLRLPALGWQYESDTVLQMIARRAKATPRQALHRNLQTCWETTVSHDRNIITLVDAQEAFHHMEIDELGLDETDRRYLGILARGGPAPLGALSAKLGLPPLTVQKVIEPYLIREDLITKGKSSARILTDKGRRHIETTAWPIR
jgi:Holliday junction DNA helicase RuvB